MSKLGKTALAMGLIATVATTPLPAFAAHGTVNAVAGRNEVSTYDQALDWHRRRWRHRDHIDGGDILAGIGILAGIAIIADAASKADRNDRDNRRYDDERPRDYEREAAPSYNNGDDVGSAVSACTDAAESSGKGSVDEIGSVTRDGAGWRVEGELGNDSFTCTVSNGRVEDIRFSDSEI